MFRNDQQRAVAYAAYKTLERMLDQDGDLPPGFYCDVSGQSVTVTLPNGSVVQRDAGTNGDGTIHKTAVQNLYGYALWAVFIHRLKKFNQWNGIRTHIIEAMREVARRPTKKVRDQLEKDFPDIVPLLEEMQDELRLPTRVEQTPRMFDKPKLPATVTIVSKRSA